MFMPVTEDLTDCYGMVHKCNTTHYPQANTLANLTNKKLHKTSQTRSSTKKSSTGIKRFNPHSRDCGKIIRWSIILAMQHKYSILNVFKSKGRNESIKTYLNTKSNFAPPCWRSTQQHVALGYLIIGMEGLCQLLSLSLRICLQKWQTSSHILDAKSSHS